MAFLGDGTGTIPACAIFFTGFQHIPDTVRQILPLFNDGTPGCPDGRILRNRQHIAEGFQILPVENRVADLLHIIGRGGPLGIDIEHDEAVETVAQGNPLHGFQGVVQRIGPGGGGVDADADQRILPPGAQNVSVFRVEIGGVEP